MFFRATHSLESWVGLSVQDGLARLARVDRQPEAPPRLAWLGQLALDAGPGAWRELIRRAGARRSHWVMVLGSEQCRLMTQDLPDAPRSEWADALRWQMKDVVDFSVDTAAIDVLAVPGPTDDAPPRGALVAMVPAVTVRAAADLAGRVGVSLAALDVVDTALRNLCALQGDSQRARALLWLDQHNSRLVVTLRGELLSTRQIDIGQARLNASPEQRESARERIVVEVQRTLDLCDRLFSYASIASLAVWPGPGVDELLHTLSRAVDLPVAEMPLLELLAATESLPQVDAAALAAHALAIGTALRTEATGAS